MKVKQSFRKKICWLFILIITFQSCVVYNKTPISISEASQIHKKVQVTRVDNKKVIFNKIEKIDGIYYGYKNVNGVYAKVSLDEKDIIKIRKKDTKKSTMLNVGICLTGVGVIFIIFIVTNPEGYFNAASDGPVTVGGKL